MNTTSSDSKSENNTMIWTDKSPASYSLLNPITKNAYLGNADVRQEFLKRLQGGKSHDLHQHLGPLGNKEEPRGSHSRGPGLYTAWLALLTHLTALQDCSISPVEQGSRVQNHYTNLANFSASLHHLPHGTGKLCNL